MRTPDRERQRQHRARIAAAQEEQRRQGLGVCPHCGHQLRVLVRRVAVKKGKQKRFHVPETGPPYENERQRRSASK